MCTGIAILISVMPTMTKFPRLGGGLVLALGAAVGQRQRRRQARIIAKPDIWPMMHWRTWTSPLIKHTALACSTRTIMPCHHATSQLGRAALRFFPLCAREGQQRHSGWPVMQ